ncbi:helix-turn-helix domain-containing protein [Enterococcus larvae]|uniref:helix-turn-helix domain-containing protein n=1 Tax=Enterococcus larvae TaxID=2794352 RepID=UPI003F3CB295
MVDLSQVLTFTEAAEKWQLAGGNTLRQAVARGRFHEDEIRKSGTVWLTTYEAMTRVFGPIPTSEEREPLILEQKLVYSALMEGRSSTAFQEVEKQAAFAFKEQRQLQIKETILGKEFVLYLFTNQEKWDNWVVLAERSFIPKKSNQKGQSS